MSQSGWLSKLTSVTGPSHPPQPQRAQVVKIARAVDEEPGRAQPVGNAGVERFHLGVRRAKAQARPPFAAGERRQTRQRGGVPGTVEIDVQTEVFLHGGHCVTAPGGLQTDWLFVATRKFGP